MLYNTRSTKVRLLKFLALLPILVVSFILLSWNQQASVKNKKPVQLKQPESNAATSPVIPKADFSKSPLYRLRTW